MPNMFLRIAWIFRLAILVPLLFESGCKSPKSTQESIVQNVRVSDTRDPSVIGQYQFSFEQGKIWLHKCSDEEYQSEIKSCTEVLIGVPVAELQEFIAEKTLELSTQDKKDQATIDHITANWNPSEGVLADVDFTNADKEKLEKLNSELETIKIEVDEVNNEINGTRNAVSNLKKNFEFMRFFKDRFDFGIINVEAIVEAMYTETLHWMLGRHLEWVEEEKLRKHLEVMEGIKREAKREKELIKLESEEASRKHQVEIEKIRIVAERELERLQLEAKLETERMRESINLEAQRNYLAQIQKNAGKLRYREHLNCIIKLNYTLQWSQAYFRQNPPKFGMVTLSDTSKWSFGVASGLLELDDRCERLFNKINESSHPRFTEFMTKLFSSLGSGEPTHFTEMTEAIYLEFYADRFQELLLTLEPFSYQGSTLTVEQCIEGDPIVNFKRCSEVDLQDK